MAQRCVRYKRVRSRRGGTVRRCAKFAGRASNGRRSGYRRRKGMARSGSHCTRYKRVPSVYGGTVRRCAHFIGGRRRRRKGGYRRGHRPYNAGKKCLFKKRVYSARMGRYVTRCASFGGGRRKAGGPITDPSRLFGPPRTFFFGPGTARDEGPPSSRYAGR